MRACGARSAVELTILLILIPRPSPAKKIAQVEELRRKDGGTKDLKVSSTSYVYSDRGNDLGSFDRLGGQLPLRLRPVHRLDSVGSEDHDDISAGRSRGLGGRKAFDSGVTDLDNEDIGGSLSSPGLNGHGPLTFELGPRDEPDDLLGHGPEHEERRSEAGEKSSAEREASSDERASKGYKVAENFDESELKERAKNEESGRYHEDAGAEKSHQLADSRHAEKASAVDSAAGEQYARDEGQRKGHKTSGYHNVYRKDEYKKDTTFYDDEHAQARSEEYGREDARRSAEEGERESAGRSEAEYELAEGSRRGLFTNGHQYGAARAHEDAEAHEERRESGESRGEAEHEASSEEAESSSSSR